MRTAVITYLYAKNIGEVHLARFTAVSVIIAPDTQPWNGLVSRVPAEADAYPYDFPGRYYLGQTDLVVQHFAECPQL